MKTLTVREAKSQLGKLVDKVQRGGPVILVNGNKLAKLERYDLLDDPPQYTDKKGILADAFS